MNSISVPPNIKKKVLILNCYFPELRESVKRSNEVPDALAPVLLSGYFDSELWDVKLYNEVNSGFLEVFKPELITWPDLIVLTSLTAAFDRLLHITAYAKSANPSVLVAAGGHAVRSLPRYSERFFDYTCTGDIEEIKEVIEDGFGTAYIADEFKPRYDLAYWMRNLGYIESSRNCNFRCGFCSLTGAGRGYEVNPLEHLDAQLEAVGKKWGVFLNDNQLLGDGKKTFASRMALIKKRIDKGQFKYWGGFVTDTFFWDQENIDVAKETGCLTLFVGVESFDDLEWLDKVNKNQNGKRNQIDIITACLDAGILFQYGLVFDPTERTIEQMYREMDIICNTPEIPLPLFTFTAIPFPGTPMFKECYEAGKILPNTNMRDLESSTLCLKPLDPVEDVIQFIKTDKNFKNYRMKAIKHQFKFLKRYWGSLKASQKIISTLSVMAILFPKLFSSPFSILVNRRDRTHVSSSDILDPVYSPRLKVEKEFQHYFEPTVLIDVDGAINPALEADALGIEKGTTTPISVRSQPPTSKEEIAL